MISKQALSDLKRNDLTELYETLNNSRDNAEKLFILENLGHLPAGFDGRCLLPLLRHENPQVRFWTVKNLGKLADEDYLTDLFAVARNDVDSMVRREAVSSIGRMRRRSVILCLLQLLGDDDPKVTLQAVRGLLAFKGDPQIQAELRALRHHPNEMVQDVIEKEFSANGNSATSGYAHTGSPEFIQNTVVLGDVRDVLQSVPDEAVHLTFTSPPYYNARDYAIYKSYRAYLDFLTEVFAEVHRVTKEGRFFILNTSPVIVPRFSRSHSSRRYPIPFDIHPRLIEIGWEFIDDIVWAKPEASVKNRNAGFLQHRKPLAYKPNAVTEYVMVYRKKSHKLLDWNIHQYDGEMMERSKVAGDYETTNLWQIDPTSDRVHSAVFPLELCSRVIRFYSYVGDLVFDPFAGSGTLGRAAENLERYFFLTEQDEHYFERIRQDLAQGTWFGNRAPRCLTLEAFRGRRRRSSPETPPPAPRS